LTGFGLFLDHSRSILQQTEMKTHRPALSVVLKRDRCGRLA
jgi:hypothetical protein